MLRTPPVQMSAPVSKFKYVIGTCFLGQRWIASWVTWPRLSSAPHPASLPPQTSLTSVEPQKFHSPSSSWSSHHGVNGLPRLPPMKTSSLTLVLTSSTPSRLDSWSGFDRRSSRMLIAYPTVTILTLLGAALASCFRSTESELGACVAFWMRAPGKVSTRSFAYGPSSQGRSGGSLVNPHGDSVLLLTRPIGPL